MSKSGQQNSGASAPTSADLVETGRALHRAGDLDAAERLYAQALAEDEDCAEAHQLMAVIAGQRGRFDEAIAGFRRTIALEGPTADRLFNLAEAYRMIGNFAAALAAYNQVLTLDASFLDAYRNCAEMAKAAAEAAASDDPKSVGRLKELAAHYLMGLGHAYLRSEGLVDAEKAYRESIALDPTKAEPYNSLGMIALESRRPVEAETLCCRALALEPNSVRYINNLGLVLLNQVRIDEGTALFRQAIAIDPSFDEARANLGSRMLPWLHYRADLTPEALFVAHRDWGRGMRTRVAGIAGASPPFTNSRDPAARLKICYLGLDASSRLARFCIEPLIANLDPKAVEIFLYPTAWKADATMLRLKELSSGWREQIAIRSPQDVARMIRGDGIDIVIDTTGHLRSNRLDTLALKPAPVAVAWLGYPDTTGLTTVDYRITDQAADPEGADAFYTERLYRLPAGSVAYRPPPQAPDVTALPAQAPGAVTFGNFDDPRKIAPPVIQAWSAILKALPAARLLMMAPEFADAGFVERFHADFRASGIDPARIEMRGMPKGPDDHLAAYAEVDAGLDTFPFNAGPTTTCEALWMGVPVVALSGDRACARMGAGLLAQVGLERLICDDVDDYVATAVQLAEDLDRLRKLRAGMRDRMRVSPLLDDHGFAQRFEAALRDMWRRWCGAVR